MDIIPVASLIFDVLAAIIDNTVKASLPHISGNHIESYPRSSASLEK